MAMKVHGILIKTPTPQIIGSIVEYLPRKNCDEDEPINTPTIPPTQAIAPKMKLILNEAIKQHLKF